jgi:hypothetical protein
MPQVVKCKIVDFSNCACSLPGLVKIVHACAIQMTNNIAVKNFDLPLTSRTKGPTRAFFFISVTCRETSDHSILEGFPTVQVFSILPTEVFGRHVVQA